jgi:RNA polymerase sigma factor (sigma-70 family)
MSVLGLLEDLRSERNVRQAQAEVYHFLRKKLLGKLSSQLPERIRSRLDPEDILHEALLRALRGLGKVEISTDNAFVAWVYRIARNLMLDELKRRSAAALPFGRKSGGKGPRASRVPSRERRVESRLQETDWIETALRGLCGREAEVVRLHMLEQRSFEEIGEAWGKKPATIKRLYSLAMHHLREAAGEKENPRP